MLHSYVVCGPRACSMPGAQSLVNIPLMEMSQWPWPSVACAMGHVNNVFIVSRKNIFLYRCHAMLQ